MRARAGAVGAAAGVVVLVATLVLTLAHGQEPDAARDIMRRVLRDSRAEDEAVDIVMELIDSRGRVRRRATTIYSKKRSAEASMRLIRFHEPPDLARSGILTIEHADRDADQWIYLPAYH